MLIYVFSFVKNDYNKSFCYKCRFPVRYKSCQHILEEEKTLFCPECGEYMKVPASMSTSNHSNKNINNYSKNQVTNPKNKELRDIIHAVKNKYEDKDMSLSQRFNNAKKEHGKFVLFMLENLKQDNLLFVYL
ncbi:hypothetical protein C1645_880394 [Glomus cerebriforme]|uniref:Uncharacterized protein n=1 Tax=Glomus cerebriforme TaxID=658196 RepID=A0A397SFG3_9GLOM|nr:hypothetical protein C1645_880394 [Glomus cerebriforme]